MIYLIGGAPRAGKSILGQQVAANLKIGWISTDLLLTLLGMTKVDGIKTSGMQLPRQSRQMRNGSFPTWNGLFGEHLRWQRIT